MRIATSKTNITLSRKTTTNSRLSVDYIDFNFATIRLCQILRLCRFIGRTLIFQVRRSAELQGSMYGRTVPNRTVQSSAISSAKFGNKPGYLFWPRVAGKNCLFIWLEARTERGRRGRYLPLLPPPPY